MKKALRVIAVFLCLFLFAGSSAMLLRSGMDYVRGASSYDTARDLSTDPHTQEIPDTQLPLNEVPHPPVVTQLPEFSDEIQAPEAMHDDPGTAAPDTWREVPVTDDPHMETLLQIDLAALRAVNPDVVGWITIPGTQLDYPIMQGEDNQYYLNNTWDRQPNSAGSVFLECQNSADFSDFNTILYGHRMKDGSMFASLKYYKTPEHRSEHPYIYIVDDSGIQRYEIFAAYEAGIKTYTYCISFTKERKTAFLTSCMERSVIDTGIAPTPNDRILTLSTCTGTGYETRWVVQARLPAAG